MNGKFYIDGIDAYARYGILVAEGGYSGLAAWAPLKSVDSNDWPDEDGLDVDLTAPVLDSREFMISFISLDTDKTGYLLEILSDMAYHVFDFQEIGYTCRLRLVSEQNKETFIRLEKFALQFADDMPLSGYTYLAPLPDPKRKTRGYEFDGKDLSDYRVWILEGSDTEIQKTPAVKKNLSVGVNKLSGIEYDSEQVTYEAKDVTLKCFIRASDSTLFWRNYNALLYDLIRPGERVFYAERIGYEYPCYYKSSAINRFEVFDGTTIWCEFSITLGFTSFRACGAEFLFSTQSGEWTMTENNQYAIDLCQLRK